MKLMVLDGNSVINRAFYGVHMLNTRDGFCTNAIFGFLNILEKLRAEEHPDALCVAFDLKGPTFRHLRYDGYKATRHPMPEELAMQMPVMKEILSAMRIPVFEAQGWEADDVIGTISVQCAKNGWDCVIVTGDRDSLQLVTDHVIVKLVCSKQSQTVCKNYTVDAFQEEYGFAPIRLIDLKSLMGDSSDNIPGVSGVGPKTASQLLWDYGTLDGIYENLPNLKEKLRTKLEAEKENAYLSYELATIVCEAPISFAPEACVVKEPDNDALFALFMRLEFTRLIERYHLHVPKQDKPCVEGECISESVTQKAQAEQILARLAARNDVSVLAFDHLSQIFVEDENTMYLFRQEQLNGCFDDVCRTLFSSKIKKITHDCKSLMRQLLEKGYPAEGFLFDTALAGYCLDATAGDYSLDTLCPKYADFSLPQADAGSSAETNRLADRMSRTSAVNALFEPMTALLKERGMLELYDTIELPLCSVLAKMEATGVLVDQMALIAFGSHLAAGIEADEKQIYEAAGKEFNINSTKQLGEILFEELKLPSFKKTKTGYSTNAEVLEKLRGQHPIVEAILDYRMLTKLKSTYADGLVKEIAEDGRIHTTFQNMVTATGRLSSTEPNLQNIPVRTELGAEIRRMFVPQDGWIFVDADYSQIELRVLSHIADDAEMQKAFLNGDDIHTATASQVFHVPAEQVSAQMRRSAKAVNFGIVYGISEFSLSEDIGVSRKEAKAYIDSYLEHYSGVRQYMKEIVAQAKETGEVSTIFGRKRAIPELHSSNFNLRSFAERVALNTPIQGTAADIMKLAMIRVDQSLREKKLKAHIVLQVHDEIIVECPPEEVALVQRIVKHEMEHVVSLKVPLTAETSVGGSWYEAK